MRKHIAFPVNPAGTVIKIALPKYPLRELMAKLALLNAGGCTIQLFDPDTIINRTHILGAYMNAVAAFRDRRSISNSMAMEMLLFASASTQIGDAIERVGAKPGAEVLVFADSASAYRKISAMVKGPRAFRPPAAAQLRAAKLYGISGPGLDQKILEKISLSRLST